MMRIKRIPQYFSLMAVILTIIVSLLNRISLVRAICRILPAALIFYMLGLCISRMLIKDMSTKPQPPGSIDLIADNDEEFAELDLPIINESENEVIGRG
jgi:hypothetical protein